ncbi:MAG: GatB/YqeY domain-containing protein [Tenericutes bacterium]|nr:GatB/YqeY domain-containing protein [Mycoplasmatota bacterium]
MLYETISRDMIQAMKAKDKETLSTLRLLKSAIDLYKINNKLDRNADASDEIVIDVVVKQVKTHKESIEEFKKANRQDLIDSLEKEITLLSKYLPEQMSTEKITEEIDKVFDKLKPTNVKEMGLIMKELAPILKGKADMKVVNSIIQEKLK